MRKGTATNNVHPDLPKKKGEVAKEVYDLVKRIPKGKVMTYGQISAVLVNRVSARAVGWIMNGAPKGVPWQRVVNASGGCSTDHLPDFPQGLQRHLLEQEGVTFRENGTLDLDCYRWAVGLTP